MSVSNMATMHDATALAAAPAAAAKPRKRKPRSGWVQPTPSQAEAAVLLDGAPALLAFAAHPGCFKRMSWPQEGEWLDEHNEKGQSVKQFARCSFKVHAPRPVVSA